MPRRASVIENLPVRAAGTEAFVTGDRALPDLRAVGEMPIVSPREAYERLIRAG